MEGQTYVHNLFEVYNFYRVAHALWTVFCNLTIEYWLFSEYTQNIFLIQNRKNSQNVIIFSTLHFETHVSTRVSRCCNNPHPQEQIHGCISINIKTSRIHLCWSILAFYLKLTWIKAWPNGWLFSHQKKTLHKIRS